MTITYSIDPFPSEVALADLFEAAWGSRPIRPFAPILARSLCHGGAFDGERLVGFVNVATDGGVHAFLLDTSVHPDFQRRGIASALVGLATDATRQRGAEWLHVDYEPHLEHFYAQNGFRPTQAGLIAL